MSVLVVRSISLLSWACGSRRSIPSPGRDKAVGETWCPCTAVLWEFYLASTVVPYGLGLFRSTRVSTADNGKVFIFRTILLEGESRWGANGMAMAMAVAQLALGMGLLALKEARRF